MTNKKLEKLYVLYHRELYLYAYSLCGDHHQAQDLASETFFKALLSLDEDKPYIKYWLFRICKNLCIDNVRKDKEESTMDKFENLLITNDTPLDKVIDNEERKGIYRSVMKLNSSYREIIVLYYYCDFSLKEISQTTGLSYGAAKTLLFRARKKLKTRLEEDNEI